jgi:hypothetical protein
MSLSLSDDDDEGSYSSTDDSSSGDDGAHQHLQSQSSVEEEIDHDAEEPGVREGIIVVAVKGAQVGEGIVVVAEKGVRVGEGIANVVTAAAAARVKDSCPSPHVGLPAAPLSSMIATPVTARPSPHVGLPTAPLSVLVASFTLVTTPPSLIPTIN